MLVIKYGGHALAERDAVLEDLAKLTRSGERIVLIHGGGPSIDADLKERGVSERRVAGLRVTDALTLAVTERVLCGEVNKAFVRALASRGVPAVGISGEDGNLLRAEFHPPIDGQELGFVGTAITVDPRVLEALLDAGFTPVVAPLALARDGSSALNVNADTAAAAIAGALAADTYIVLTDVARIRRDARDPASGIAGLSIAEAQVLFDAGVFEGGMRPKVLGVFDALGRGAKRAIVGAAGPGAIAAALHGETGTEITG